MNALINFSFEEQLVRVVTIESEPWWVATDVARVLGFRHTPHMVRLLDDDEKGVRNVDTLGGRQELSIVSLSGVLHATLKSRRPEARQFRRWVTGEVLPQILHTGKYAPEAANDDGGHAPGVPFDPVFLNASVATVRMALRLWGPDMARRIWLDLGLPIQMTEIAAIEPRYLDKELVQPLTQWLAENPMPTLAEATGGVGLDPESEASRERVRKAMRMFGWWSKRARRGGELIWAWFPPETPKTGSGR